MYYTIIYSIKSENAHTEKNHTLLPVSWRFFKAQAEHPYQIDTGRFTAKDENNQLIACSVAMITIIQDAHCVLRYFRSDSYTPIVFTKDKVVDLHKEGARLRQVQ